MPAIIYADKELLEAFEDTVHVGSDAFTYTIGGVAKTVRLLGPVNYTTPYGNTAHWRAEFEIEEV